MALYNIVDHRAPRWLTQAEDPDTALINAGLVFVSFFVFAALVSVGLWFLLIPWFAACIVLNVYFQHFVHPINGMGLVDYDINKYMQEMLREYKSNPSPDTEKLLISSYKLAGKGDIAAIRERLQLVRRYNAQRKSLVDSEIDEFKALLSVRQEMIKEGLL